MELSVRHSDAIDKFTDPHRTADGEPRASVVPIALKTLWFNTGTLCNLACQGCYIESSPRNDSLAYLSRSEVRRFLDEAQRYHPKLGEIGFTGGEPFMNPGIMGMLEDALETGYRVLVLTNAMAPMRQCRQALADLNTAWPDQLAIRVSMDHYTPEGHEMIRGRRSWKPTIEGLQWLSNSGFDVSVAARLFDRHRERQLRHGFANLFTLNGIAVDASDPHRLVLFPEMDGSTDVPEISEHCWGRLGKNPADIMCATSRMVVKRKGDDRPLVVSCTLLPFDEQFEMGRSLAEAWRPVRLNHPHCAKFCVLGGASCSQ
ncbi:MAG: radical SAM protein [Gammaproteobacteria bacterium]|nr:radical SAM protein [Gammaproteobacteria bacterium]